VEFDISSKSRKGNFILEITSAILS